MHTQSREVTDIEIDKSVQTDMTTEDVVLKIVTVNKCQETSKNSKTGYEL